MEWILSFIRLTVNTQCTRVRGDFLTTSPVHGYNEHTRIMNQIKDLMNRGLIERRPIQEVASVFDCASHLRRIRASEWMRSLFTVSSCVRVNTSLGLNWLLLLESRRGLMNSPRWIMGELIETWWLARCFSAIDFWEGAAVIALNCAHDGTIHSLLKRRWLSCDYSIIHEGTALDLVCLYEWAMCTD